ncbi:MAG TPA: DUF6527 family protein [Polyangiaceae bacterium]
MTKTWPITKDGQPYGYCVWCPACDDSHHFQGWNFNGDHERPTFTPSMLVRYAVGDPSDPASGRVCHSYLTDGVWNYLPDCTHAHAGKSLPAPDWPYPNYGSGT